MVRGLEVPGAAATGSGSGSGSGATFSSAGMALALARHHRPCLPLAVQHRLLEVVLVQPGRRSHVLVGLLLDNRHHVSNRIHGCQEALAMSAFTFSSPSRSLLRRFSEAWATDSKREKPKAAGTLNGVKCPENPGNVFGFWVLLEFNEVAVHFIEVLITLDKKLLTTSSILCSPSTLTATVVRLSQPLCKAYLESRLLSRGSTQKHSQVPNLGAQPTVSWIRLEVHHCAHPQ